jgi:ribosomal protein S18 acetylase RimI-like enzyme
VSEPSGSREVYRGEYAQMVAVPSVEVASAGESELLVLGPDDEPEMAALVARTEPGPWASRTLELGTYLGVRRGPGAPLVAMAGQRMRVAGATEISSVCTDPAFRGQGLARALVGTLRDEIHARGDVAFLHVRVDNASAIASYTAVGFVTRCVLVVQAFVAAS